MTSAPRPSNAGSCSLFDVLCCCFGRKQKPKKEPLSDAAKKELTAKRMRAFNNLRELYKGSSKEGAYPLIEKFQCELFDRKHRYCKELALFFKVWVASKSQDNFDTWMSKLDAGENVPGKDALREHKPLKLLGKDDKPIHLPSVRYLTNYERRAYEMQVDAKGCIFTKNNNDKTFHSKDESKETANIFVIMPDDKILIGQYQRGAFGHTSMTRGGMVKCAGAMLFKDGKLTALWDDSGHYNSAAYRAGNYELNTNRMLFALKTLQARGVDISETVMFLTKVDGPNKVINKIKATDFLLQQKK